MRTGYRGSRREFVADHPNAVDSSRYAAKLEQLAERFPADHVLTVLFEDVTSDPAGTARTLFEFVGVDPTVTVDTARRENVTRGVRWRAAAELRRRVRAYALDSDQRWLLELGRRLHLGKLTVTSRHRRGVPPRIGDAEADELRALFAEDVERTARLLDRDLQSIWRTER